MGYSLGSFILGLTGAIEPRLRACVLVGGGNFDGPEGYWDRSGKTMCQSTPYRSLSFLGDRPAAIYALNARRGATLVYNGLADTVVAIPGQGEPFFADLRQRSERLRGSAVNLFEVGFVPEASHRPYFVTRPVALWLDGRLDLPAWSRADIETMRETHIGAWAQARGVAMDRLYATESARGVHRLWETIFPPSNDPTCSSSPRKSGIGARIVCFTSGGSRRQRPGWPGTPSPRREFLQTA